jgi:hypothetical protein
MALKRLIGCEVLVGGGETATPVEQVLPPEAATYVLGVLVVCAQQGDDLAATLRELAAGRKEEPRLEVVVVSLEEDEQPFMDSVRDLPWPALPRAAAHKKVCFHDANLGIFFLYWKNHTAANNICGFFKSLWFFNCSPLAVANKAIADGPPCDIG